MNFILLKEQATKQKIKKLGWNYIAMIDKSSS